MSKTGKQSLGIYIHIPFCLKRCNYCSFYSNAGVNRSLQGQYVSAVLKEWTHYEIMGHQEDRSYETLYIGGGTPTVLDAANLERLLAGLAKSLDLSALSEFTVEANPGTIDEEKLQLLKDFGCNRLSIGAQSFDPAYLQWLGRCHGVREIYESFELAHKLGYTNINMDLMYGLAGQKTDQWAETLDEALALEPDHFSLYQLNIEPDTPFGSIYAEKGHYLIDEEESREQYMLAREILTANGYNHYEISNYAKEGKESRHNLLYWDNREYIGLGAGASGYLDGVRYTNVDSLEAYARSLLSNMLPRAFEETITKSIAMEEEIMLSFRKAQGLDKEMFYQKYGENVNSIWEHLIKKYVNLGMLKENEVRLWLTPEGFLQSNEIILDFIKEIKK